MKSRNPRLLKIGKSTVAGLIGRRLYLSPVLLFCLILSLSACDLSWLTGKSSGAPATPMGLTVTGVTSTTASLSWSASSGAMSYQLFRNGTKVYNNSATSYTDSGLAPSTSYQYTVQASNASGSSAQSPSVTATASAGGGGSGGSSLITSYGFLASNNPSLTQDATATITAPDVYVILPYSVIQAQTPLTPTVTLASGYSISPSGSYVPTDGMTLVLTNTSDQSIHNYKLHVSVDPNSIAFLQLGSPFYYDSSGNKQTLKSSQYTLSLATLTNTYTLLLNTDNFTLPYVVNAVQNIVTSRPIGFSTANVPYGSFTTNLSAALGGTVCPYSVTVQSPNKSITNTFTIQAARTKSNIVQLTDVSATIAYIYAYTISQAYADATLSNFLGTVWAPSVPPDSISDQTGSYGSYGHSFSDVWNALTNSTVTNNTVFTATGAQWGPALNWSAYCTAATATPQAAINNNVSTLNSILASPVSGYTTSGSATIDEGTSYTISSALSGVPGINPSVTSTGKTISLSAVVTASCGQGNYSDNYTCNVSRSLYVPITQTDTFTPQSYPEFLQIIVKFPHYTTINQIAPNSTYVANWNKAVSADGNDWVVTFNMVPTLSHWTAIFAQMQLASETGTVTTYSLAVN
jgi:hypothetical protein